MVYLLIMNVLVFNNIFILLGIELQNTNFFSNAGILPLL